MKSFNLLFDDGSQHKSPSQGYNTYLKDVLSCCGDAMSINSEDPHEYSILFHWMAKPSYIPYEADKVVRILHSGEHEVPNYDLINYGADKLIYVTQYEDQADFLCGEGLTAHFVPMMVDTSCLPSRQGGNGKWVYYGNIYDDKKDTVSHLLDSIDLDVISFGRLNGSERVMDRQECLSLVSQYSYGVGVGRCAIEMASMGMPVLIAGRSVGGTLISNEDVTFHSKCNYNSNKSNSLGLKADIEKVISDTVSINTEFFSMSTSKWLGWMGSL